jgi:hypothetical protein
MNQCIFIIECENNKFYVDEIFNDIGVNDNHTELINELIIKYTKDETCEFTLKYKPLQMLNFNVRSKGCSIYYPNRTTIKRSMCHIYIKNIDELVKYYWRQYGINNVRGGSYKDIIIPQHIIKKLNFELLCSGEYCCYCVDFHKYDSQCIGKNIDTTEYLKNLNTIHDINIRIKYYTDIYNNICILIKQIRDCREFENSTYEKYILNTYESLEMREFGSYKNEEIKRLELNNFFVEKKIEFINTIKKHKSMYYVEDLLKGLYKKKFILIENME